MCNVFLTYTKRSYNLSVTNTGRFQIVLSRLQPVRDDLHVKTYPTCLKQLENALDVFVTYQERIFVRKPIELIFEGEKIIFRELTRNFRE